MIPPVIILAGGLGTRLRSLTGDKMPKPMVPFKYQGKEYPFLAFLLKQLYSQGIRRVVLCVDHLADQIVSYFGDGSHYGLEITYDYAGHVKTASRVRHAMKQLNTHEFIVHCGDVFHPIDLALFLNNFSKQSKDIMQVAVKAPENDQCILPNIEIDNNFRVINYKTNAQGQNRIVKGTCVLAVRRELINFLPDTEDLSLTKDIYPTLIDHQLIGAWESQTEFYDIGTPKDYEEFCKYILASGIEPLHEKVLQCV
jgi:mannose-1-phosphate guanylyltransferase